MTHDPLRELLTRTDAVAVTTKPRDGLAVHVRAEALRRRSRTRRAFGAASIVLIAVGAASSLFRSPPQTPVADVAVVAPDPADLARVREEITALRHEATAREATVAAMIAGEARGRRPPARPAVDALDRIRDQQDLAALALVRQADRFYHDLARPQRAAAAYERVVELFPQTPWAAVARQRLNEIKS
jgi:hypothetical protein